MSWNNRKTLRATLGLSFTTLLAGCATGIPAAQSTKPPVAGASTSKDSLGMTRISGSAFEFPAPQSEEDTLQTAALADFNNAPINIWVSKDSSGQVTKVRVTGHAVAWVCAQASLTLQEFLSDSATVSGFLNYGVGEMRPASPSARAAFSSKATQLIAKLEEIDRDNADEVQVHPVAELPDELTPPAASENAEAPFAVRRVRSPKNGPAFIPVKRWEQGSSPVPVTLTLDNKLLGDIASLIATLSSSAGTAPIAELIERSRNRIDRIRSLEDWRNAGHRLNDEMYSFVWQGQTYSPTPQRLDEATNLMRSYVRKYDALALLLPGESAFQRPSVRQEVRSIEQAIATNDLCRLKLMRGLSCQLFFSAEQRPPDMKDAQKAAKTLTSLMGLVDAQPMEVF